MFDLTADALIALVGAFLSLFLAYFPWVKDKFDALDARAKPLVNAFILLVGAWIYLGFKCDFQWACLQAGAGQLFEVWVSALFGNMVAYQNGVRQFKQVK